MHSTLPQLTEGNMIPARLESVFCRQAGLWASQQAGLGATTAVGVPRTRNVAGACAGGTYKIKELGRGAKHWCHSGSSLFSHQPFLKNKLYTDSS